MSGLVDFLGGPLMVQAALVAAAVSALAGPLGCFAVWRRMAYLGDATAHAALLGVAIGLIYSIDIWLAAFAVALFIAAGSGVVSFGGRVAPDAAIGALSHSALAIALVAVSLATANAHELQSYLFTRDVLAVASDEVWLIVGAAIVGLGFIAFFWRPLLNSTLSPELSAAEGGAPRIAQLGLMVALAVYVALAMRLVGLLLSTALLILPAVASRPLARRPETMATAAALFGAIGAILGLTAAYQFNTPSGPSIVTTLFVLLVLSLGGAAALRALRRRTGAADAGFRAEG